MRGADPDGASHQAGRRGQIFAECVDALCVEKSALIALLHQAFPLPRVSRSNSVITHDENPKAAQQ
jgi:hypothetical protein